MIRNKLRRLRTLSKKVILEYGRFLRVEEHCIQLPDGRIIPDWAWVSIPDAVIILARMENGNFLVFKQTKYAIPGESFAPVGGMLEAGEKPLSAAKRELLEEMGCEAKKWVTLGSYLLDPNRGVATMHLFLALNARIARPPDSDDLEDQQMMELTLEELQDALTAGRFKIMAWAGVAALALNHLSK